MRDKIRKRKVNLDKMSREEIDQISVRLGDKTREIVDRACDEANKLLNIYGLKVKMQFALEELKTADMATETKKVKEAK